MPFKYAVLVAVLPAAPVRADTCVDCHRHVIPNIVSDWQLSKHSQKCRSASDIRGRDCSIAWTAELRICYLAVKTGFPENPLPWIWHLDHRQSVF